jgi:hypothetical protein
MIQITIAAKILWSSLFDTSNVNKVLISIYVTISNYSGCPENLKFREKLKVLFSVGTAGTIWQIFFLMFVIIRMRFLCKEKLEKLPGKLENRGKTESAFL